MAEAGLSPAAAMSQMISTGQMLGPDRVDDLGRALLLLARELWVTKDRQRVLEAVLEDHGIRVSDAVRDYQPSGALAATLAAERKAFTEGLVNALYPAGGVA